MVSILIITLIAFVLFLLLTGFFVMRDFSRLWLRHSATVFLSKHGVNYYSELAVTLVVVLALALAAAIFKGAATILVAMVTTDDIAQFTTALRGTFSSYTTELQSSKNYILQFLLNPALKMIAVLVMMSGIKLYFTRINKKAGGDCFNESDVYYFSSIGMLFLISIEILCHIQSVRFLNMYGNMAYLLLDKFSYILIFLTLEEVRMLRSNKNQLTEAIDKYLITARIERKTMLSGWKQLVLAYLLCLSMALPGYLGFQWIRDNTTLMTVFIVVLAIALLVMKKVFSDAWNLMGTVMFASALETPIDDIRFSSKSRLPVIIGLFWIGGLLVAFGIAFPRQLFMLLLIMAVAVCLMAFGVVAIYFLTMGLSSLIAYITKRDATTSSAEKCFTYMGWVLSSLPKAIAVPAVVVTLAFMAMTCSPKDLNCDNIYPNCSIVDTNGNWLYIDMEEHDHYYTPVLYDELPEFFKRALVYQEDRCFFQQNELLPNTSNWHGISLSVFRGRGGSNLNAQLVKNITYIDADGFPRDMSRKLSEMVSGYMVSQRETPEHIMEMYVNVASFHGTFAGFRGLNAASLYAFGKPIGQLNQLQQLYLVNTLPHSVFVKGKGVLIAYNAVQDNPQAVKEVLLSKASRWYDEGLISKKELNTLKRQELDFTNCRYKSNIPMATRLRFERNRVIPGRRLSYITLENEQAMTRAYNDFRNSSVFRKNGAELEVASIVVDVHNGHVIAHYSSGMIDYTDYRDGFAIGSLGKPFIVTQMLEMGASPNLTLYDGRKDGRKTPKNANHGWSNRYVNITEALSKSLNAPFVNLPDLNLNPRQVFLRNEDCYRKMGIRSEQCHVEMCDDTYNYPLGLRQMYVTEVAQAFQTLMNDGLCYPLLEYDLGDTVVPFRVYEAKDVAVVKQALSQTIVSGTMKAYRNSLPEGRTYYAKTGTSTRQQYGWAVVSDGNLLVVSLASYGKRHGDNMTLGVESLYGGSTAGLMSVLVYNEINKTH